MSGHQKLPGAGPLREALRRKGQFWTPDWVAEAMVAYVVSGGSSSLYDPAVGAGAFFRAAKKVSNELNRRLLLSGSEVDRHALDQAKESGLSSDDLSHVRLKDFVLHPPKSPLDAVVGNPPYIRHHRLPAQLKTYLKQLSIDITGSALDGRAGLHIYFLIRGLQLLADGGRLAFIMPADTCEGVFSSVLWKWVSDNYKLEAVVTFSPEAAPFKGVDTNALIFLIKKSKPAEQFFWARCLKYNTPQLKEWMQSELSIVGDDLLVEQRSISEGLTTGLSRARRGGNDLDLTLGSFARVMRGIATGANEFFFLTRSQAAGLNIPDEFLLPAVGRTRDVPGDVIDASTIQALDQAGRPTLLFSPDGRPLEKYTRPMREYLRRGEELGLHQRSLIATRRPWYKMEARNPPPFLFAYLGRRNIRFIRNLAGVMPLTGFLCVYPLHNDEEFINGLWAVLRHPDVINNLSLVGKSYGGGAIKVEPRGLERLRLPVEVVRESGIEVQPLPLKSVANFPQQALW